MQTRRLIAAPPVPTLPHGQDVEGAHHAFQIEADARRTAFLEAAGWRVIRFWANEVVANPEGVWHAIDLFLGDG